MNASQLNCHWNGKVVPSNEPLIRDFINQTARRFRFNSLSREDYEDITQIVMLKLHRFQSEIAELGRWLCRVVRHTVYDFVGSSHKRKEWTLLDDSIEITEIFDDWKSIDGNLTIDLIEGRLKPRDAEILRNIRVGEKLADASSCENKESRRCQVHRALLKTRSMLVSLDRALTG